MDYPELLATIAKILDDHRVPYMVTGGYAVTFWGRARATFDIDIVIELFPEQIPSLRKALQNISEISYIDEWAMKEALERKGEFNFIYPELGTKVDFFVRTKDPTAKRQLGRKLPVAIGNQKVFFTSPEDLILSKLDWYKKGKSSRHLEDIRSIVQKQKRLDWKYLNRWAKIQSTEEILQSLINKNN